MKDLIILTDQPISYDKVAQIIKDNWKHLNLLNDDCDLLYMKKKHVGFELEFTPNDVLDDPNCMMEETVDRCPNKKAFLTNLSYTSIYVAKKNIELMMPYFGKMWIQSDEADDWFGTAEEFIKNYQGQ